MSTEYYKLRPPITSVRCTERGSHIVMSVWINHGLAGDLIMDEPQSKQILRGFRHTGIGPAVRTYWGGDGVGLVVEIEHINMPDQTLLISEYGDLITVLELDKQRGEGKKQ